MNRKSNFLNVFISILVGLTLIFSVVNPMSVSASALPARGDGIRRSVHPQTGALTFLGTDADSPIRVEAAMKPGISPEARGNFILNMYGPDFGIRDPKQELSVMRMTEAGEQLTTHYQQIYNKIPVMGGELIVNMKPDGSLLSISGEASPNLHIDTQPKLTKEQASRIALDMIAKTYNMKIGEMEASKPELWIFDERLIQDNATQPVQLVWRMEVASANAPLRELVLVNAKTGKISLHFNQNDTAWKGMLVVPRVERFKDDRVDVASLSADAKSATAPIKVAHLPITAPVPGSNLFVNVANGNDANDCLYPASACLTINGALAKPQAQGNTIYVAEGVYAGTGISIVTIQKSLTVSGGWNTDFTTQTGYSTLDGQNVRRGMDISGPYIVNLDRFEFKNGKGSGIYTFQATLTVDHSFFHDNNYDGGSGGGINNIAGNLYINRSTFYNNSARNGGGVSTSGYNAYHVELNYVTISGNNADYGGGIFVNDPGEFIVKNSIIAQNTAQADGSDCKHIPQMSSISGGYNIVSTTCGTAQATDHFNTDPKLGVFLPKQGYIPIYPDSPAINNSDNTCGSGDQRGVAAVDVCDAGAFEFVHNNGTPVSIWAISGGDQRTPPSSTFLKPLTAVVLDGQGNPVSGVSVTFSAPASGASAVFQGAGTSTEGPLVTNAVGAVTSSTVIANSALGTYIINAEGGAVGTATFVMANAGWYVSSAGNDANNCASPAEPCATINGAILKAIDGDTIFVTKDVFTGSGTEVVLVDKPVHLSGGWDAAFASQTGYTTINGESSRRCILVEKKYVSTPILVTIDRFIVRNGYISFGSGGGIDNEYETLELQDSILENNYARSGGGIFSTGGSLTLNRVIVRKNHASYGAGGVEAGSNTSIMNSVISDNTSNSNGGGLGVSGISTVANTTIARNSSGGRGGGVRVGLTLSGGPVFRNVTIVDNYASEYGGGFYYEYYSHPYPVIYESIISGNSASLSSPDCAGNFTGDYNILGASCSYVSGTNNLFGVDPKLGAYLPTEGYYPLQLGSPAINGGNPATPGSNSSACETVDIRGLPRNDARCDIGAFEWKTPGAAAKIVPVSYNLRIPPNTTFEQPLQAAVLDAFGNPAGAGISLTFTAPSSGPSGTFANGTKVGIASTNENGIAATSKFTTNDQLGIYAVGVTGSGLTPTELPLSNIAWYVSVDGNDANSCQSPASACLTINAAIEKAQAGDTIYVSQGTYKRPSSSTDSSVVRILKSITIVGGWNPAFTAPGMPTFIDGERTVMAIYAYAAVNAHLSNLIVRNATRGIDGSYSSLILERVSVIDNVNEGILQDYGTFEIYNSTISNNWGGGAILVHGNINIHNSTIAHNISAYPTAYGGGLQVTFGAATLENSIVSNNDASQSPDCYADVYNHGTIVSNGHNIIGNITGCAITTSTGDQFNVDPQIRPLLSLGYHPLVSTSPAINNGNVATCTKIDQRGVNRLGNGYCDVGAYEYKTPGSAIAIVNAGPEIRRSPIQTPFMEPFRVAVVDAFGSPVGGVSIIFNAPASGASGTFLSTGTANESTITTEHGIAESSVFTANGQIGDYSVVATSPGITAPLELKVHNGAWLVSPTGDDANDCLSVTSTCATIGGALNKPLFNSGEVVWVAAGTYSNSIAQNISNSASIIGGWNASFTGPGGATYMQEHLSFFREALVKRIVLTGSGSLSGSNLTIQDSAIYRTELGISNEGNLNLINVTITGNGNYYPAIRNYHGTIFIKNSTITGNTGYQVGGIDNGYSSTGIVILQNTILAGNSATSSLSGYYASVDCAGKIISMGHNIIGTVGTIGNSNTYPCKIVPTSTDLIGDDANPIPVSAVLETTPSQDPATGQWYHPLKLGGLAIDAGSTAIPGSSDVYACPATDQLGRARPQGVYCDIGAVEYQFNYHPPQNLLVTYDAGNTISLPGTQVCSGNNAACAGGDAQEAAAQANAYSTYQQYQAWHGRDSVDGNGLQIISVVHYGTGYKNAFWNGHMMIYGDGYGFPLADDVVAHELTHGVTQYESNLFYWYQSGAINESFSDLWGEAVDQVNGLGNDSPTVKWLLGEDITGLGAVRNMQNPPLKNQPDMMTSTKYCKVGTCLLTDNGGVHINSGVNNKAAYLMVEGGTFNSKVVSPLGWDKVLTIYYEAQTHLLTSGSDYLDLYNALYQACLNKVGTNGITTADCQEVRDATDAVKMNFQPIANFNPDADNCPSGSSKYQDLYVEDFETDTSDWNLTALPGMPVWEISPVNSASGSLSLWANDGFNQTDSAATMKTGISLPPNSKAFLHFTHAYNFDTVGTAYYDGGVLEYSTDNGVSWLDAKPLYSAGQNYKGTLKIGYGNPIGGRLAFAGDSHGYVDSRYSLSSLAGKSVQFRWRMGTDQAYAVTGWFVDDVRIYTCIGVPSVPALSLPASNVLLTDYTPTFDWSDSTPASDVHHYDLQLATDATFTQNVVNFNNLSISTHTPLVDLASNTKYYWRVRSVNAAGGASAWSASRYFRTALLPPNSIGPGNIVPDAAVNVYMRRPTFTWDAVAGATGYTVEVSTLSTFATKAINATAKTNSYTHTTDLAANTVYYWRVKTTGLNGPSIYSQVRTFKTGNPPSVPALVAPANGALQAKTTPTLDWSNSTVPVGAPIFYAYQVQIANDSAFNSIVSTIAVIGATNSQTVTPTLLKGNTYYWRVRALNVGADGIGGNADDEMSGWSLVRSFRISTIATFLGFPITRLLPQ